MKLLIVCAVLLFTVLLNITCVNQVYWEWAFGSEGEGNAITKVSDGVVVVGQVTTTDFAGKTVKHAGDSDIAIVRFNTKGDVVWVKTAGGTGKEYCSDVTTTSDDGVIIGGFFTSQASFDDIILKSEEGDTQTYFIAKYDKDGKCLFAKAIGAQSSSIIALTTTKDGGFAVMSKFDKDDTIYYNITKPGLSSMFVAKYDRDANLQWVQTAGGPSGFNPYKLCSAADGGLYATGGFTSEEESPAIFDGKFRNSTGEADGFIVKYNVTGSIDWIRTFGGAKNDYAVACFETADSGLLVTGTMRDTYTIGTKTVSTVNLNEQGILILKYSKEGNVEWANTASGTTYSYPTAVVESSDRGVIVVGAITSEIQINPIVVTSAGSEDIFVAKYFSNGTLNWVDITGSSESDESGNGVAIDGDDIYITGYYYSSSINFEKNQVTLTGSEGMFVAKYSAVNCYGKLMSDSNVCDGEGKCIKLDKCCCRKGYAGHECQRTKNDEPYYYTYC
jgi:hypothetical protein